jgi:beta-lactamase superfamily II metal-dependent hydrolase
MFTVEMLPAKYGDCLWVEYGDRQSPRRILIDGGISGTYDAIVERACGAGDHCAIELLVVSHVDIDHIDGIVKFLANLPPGVEIKEIWFNGWQHLPKPLHSRLGGPSGEKLTVMIEDLKLPWNERSGGRSKAVVIPADGMLTVTLEGGLALTALSPTDEGLRKLRPKYAKECEKAGLIPGSLPGAREALERDKRLRPKRLGAAIDVPGLAAREYGKDSTEPNGSSIAFLAEFDGKSCLFAADAFPEVLVESIANGLNRKRLRVDAFKLAHHGSKANSSPELLELVRADRYLISTNGSIFDHPDPETIARILTKKKGDVELWFNYDQEHTRMWGDDILQRQWGYRAHFPKSQQGWLRVEL